MQGSWLVLSVLSSALCIFSAGAQAAVEAGEQYVEPLFPTRTAPPTWATEPGTRLEMTDFAAKYSAERRCWKVKVIGQTEAQYKQNLMGTYGVGDTVYFLAMVGDTQSNYGVLLTAAGYAGSYHSSECHDTAVRPRLILAFTKPLKDRPLSCSPDGVRGTTSR